MNNKNNEPGTGSAIDTALSLLVLFALLAWCIQILAPFVWLIVWGSVIAISLQPAFLKLTQLLRGRKKLAAAIFVIIGFSIMIVPLWVFTTNMLGDLAALRERISDGTLAIPAPNEDVRSWPLIGDAAYRTWVEASSDLSRFLSEHSAQIESIALTGLARIAGIGLTAIQFLISILIAAALLLGAEKSRSRLLPLFQRFSPQNGESLMKLTVATTRSVAVGVLGIAGIQALLAGIGLTVVGVPGAAVWILVVLLLAIAQLPPLLILLPVSIYAFSTETITVAVAFLIWNIVVSFADAVLKPMLLGRGVDAPMPVILIGAVGGMLSYGVIGLFLGAVVLAVGYKLFEAWIGASVRPAPVDAVDAVDAEHAD